MIGGNLSKHNQGIGHKEEDRLFNLKVRPNEDASLCSCVDDPSSALKSESVNHPKVKCWEYDGQDGIEEG
jgi:hypothetical protein